jgi:hypothetical protein
MDAEGRTYGEQLAAMLAAAAQELRQLSARAHRLTGADLDTVLPLVDALTAVAAAGRFTIAAEAEGRGEVAASLAGTLAQWVSERCPSLEMREAGQVAKAVRELGTPTLSVAREAVAAGRISVASGCVVASEWRQLLPLVEPAAHDAVVAGMVAIGESDGCPGVRALRPALLAKYGLGELLQEIEDRHRGLTALSCGHDIGGGITEYRMRLDPEARAVVEAAINTLSAPAGTDGARDVRTVDQRRGDALVAVCRRVTAISPTRTPSTLKATVIVTIPLADLRDRTRPGVLVGGLDGGTPLGPETVRRLACDGAVIPAVLDSAGQLLRLGRTRRLFTSAQVRGLWLRDRHCTFPRCAAPATWCHAHHVRHWIDGGASDLDNAALLCERHHTIVHRDRLSATVTPTGVRWELLPGSYDRFLSAATATDPPSRR